VRRPLAILLLVVFFAVVAASDLWQVAAFLGGVNDEPALLVVLHSIIGLLGAAAALALWRRSPAAVGLIAAWGVLTAALLVSLTVVLDLPPEARPGLWGSAAAVLVAAGLAAGYVRRRVSA